MHPLDDDGRGAPPYQGQPPPPAYSNYNPGYPPTAQDPLAGLLTGKLANPWVPAAFVSAILPGIGHCFLTRRDLSAVGVKIFFAYLIVTVAVPLAFDRLGVITDFYPFQVAWPLFNILRVAAHVLAMLHTHDMACKLHPVLGQPILFKK